MTGRMKKHTCNPLDTISIINFLETLKLAYNNNSVHKDAALPLFHIWMNHTPSVVQNTCLSAERTGPK